MSAAHWRSRCSRRHRPAPALSLASSRTKRGPSMGRKGDASGACATAARPVTGTPGVAWGGLVDGDRVWDVRRPRAPVTLGFRFFPDSVSPSMSPSSPICESPKLPSLVSRAKYSFCESGRGLSCSRFEPSVKTFETSVPKCRRRWGKCPNLSLDQARP